MTASSAQERKQRLCREFLAHARSRLASSALQQAQAESLQVCGCCSLAASLLVLIRQSGASSLYLRLCWQLLRSIQQLAAGQQQDSSQTTPSLACTVTAASNCHASRLAEAHQLRQQLQHRQLTDICVTCRLSRPHWLQSAAGCTPSWGSCRRIGLLGRLPRL